MTMREFTSLQPGDHVRIVPERKGMSWNSEGRMDHWLGHVMTVRKKECDCVRMAEDNEEFNGNGWAWFPHMIECVVMEDPPEASDVSDFLGF